MTKARSLSAPITHNSSTPGPLKACLLPSIYLQAASPTAPSITPSGRPIRMSASGRLRTRSAGSMVSTPSSSVATLFTMPTTSRASGSAHTLPTASSATPSSAISLPIWPSPPEPVAPAPASSTSVRCPATQASGRTSAQPFSTLPPSTTASSSRTTGRRHRSSP